MLDEFIRIHEAKHGEKLDRDEAYKEAINLMRLIELVESNIYKNL